jgi:hypothetical protein
MSRILTIDKFGTLCNNLSALQSITKLTPKQITKIIDSLAGIIEYTIYGDDTDEAFFLFFCEKKMMKVIYSILMNKNCGNISTKSTMFLARFT